MPWIKTIAREVFGLFVDDELFAASILIWIGVAWLAFPRLGIPASWSATLFFLGLAAILVESTLRRSRP